MTPKDENLNSMQAVVLLCDETFLSDELKRLESFQFK